MLAVLAQRARVVSRSAQPWIRRIRRVPSESIRAPKAHWSPVCPSRPPARERKSSPRSVGPALSSPSPRAASHAVARPFVPVAPCGPRAATQLAFRGARPGSLAASHAVARPRSSFSALPPVRSQRTIARVPGTPSPHAASLVTRPIFHSRAVYRAPPRSLAVELVRFSSRSHRPTCQHGHLRPHRRRMPVRRSTRGTASCSLLLLALPRSPYVPARFATSHAASLELQHRLVRFAVCRLARLTHRLVVHRAPPAPVAVVRPRPFVSGSKWRMGGAGRYGRSSPLLLFVPSYGSPTTDCCLVDQLRQQLYLDQTRKISRVQQALPYIGRESACEVSNTQSSLARRGQ